MDHKASVDSETRRERRPNRPWWNFYLTLAPRAAVGLISLLYPIGAEVIAYLVRVRSSPERLKAEQPGCHGAAPHSSINYYRVQEELPQAPAGQS